MAQGQIRHLVEQAIDEVPEPSRRVLVSRVLERMSVEETANVLSLRPETVKTRLHRARSMLRNHLENKIGPALLDAFPFGGIRCERMTERIIQLLGFR